MPFPHLTFISRLDSASLADNFSDQVLAELAGMKASVSLGILDFSPERAEVTRRLVAAGIPVIAWLLMPKETDWCNLDNAERAAGRYEAFLDWSREQGLHWAGIGLDVEPDIYTLEGLSGNRWKLVVRMFSRIFEWKSLREAKDVYCELVERIQADGYRVETYQFPFIVDERRARSTLLQRAACLIDLPADREVLLLYSSVVRPNGPGVIWSYAPEARSVAVGSTGTSPGVEGYTQEPLSWEELSRDLRLAWVYRDDIYIFSLEGCLKQGYFQRLKDFEWDHPIVDPDLMTFRINNLRGGLRTALWVGAHPWIVLGSIAGILLLIWGIRRNQK